jgi:hypothetical protein
MLRYTGYVCWLEHIDSCAIALEDSRNSDSSVDRQYVQS